MQLPESPCAHPEMAGLVTRGDLYLRAQFRNEVQVKGRAQSRHECVLPAGSYHGAGACTCNGEVLHAMHLLLLQTASIVGESAVQKSTGQVWDCEVDWGRRLPRKDHDT